MTALDEVEPRLQWFVGQMREKLALPENQAKSDWRSMKPLALLRAIDFEFMELRRAFAEIYPVTPMAGPSIGGERERAALIRECADLANVAMMLADYVRSLET